MAADKEPSKVVSAAKGAAKTAAKRAAKEAVKSAASSLWAAAMAHPMVAAIVAAVVLLIGLLILVIMVLTVGYLSGAVGTLYDEEAAAPFCEEIPTGGDFNVDAHQPALGSYQGVKGIVDGYRRCVDPRLIYILSDIAEAGFVLTESWGFGIAAHHYWVGAFYGGKNRFSSVCPEEKAETGCWESPHKQGRGIDLRAINGEVSDEIYYTEPEPVPAVDPTVGSDPAVTFGTTTVAADPDPSEEGEGEGKAIRLSEPQKLVQWLTCEYAPTATFGFVLVWSPQWEITNPPETEEQRFRWIANQVIDTDPDALLEPAAEPFEPCDEPPGGRFAFAQDEDHTGHVHLDVRCGPRWHRPGWDPKGPFQGANWQRDQLVMRCGEKPFREELALSGRILAAHRPATNP